MDPSRSSSSSSARRGIVAVALAIPLLLGGCLPTSEADPDPLDVTAPPVSVPTTDPVESEEGQGEDPGTMEDSMGEDPGTMEDSMGEDPGTMEDSPATGTATLSMAGESFSFTPTLCLVSDPDILVSAPGLSNEEGIPSFLSVDFTEYDGGPFGGVRVERGTDQPFDSTDDFYTAELNADEADSVLTVQGNGFVFEAEWRSAGGVPIGPGTLTVDCDAA